MNELERENHSSGRCRGNLNHRHLEQFYILGSNARIIFVISGSVSDML
jgi:hypothetical protein